MKIFGDEEGPLSNLMQAMLDESLFRLENYLSGKDILLRPLNNSGYHRLIRWMRRNPELFEGIADAEEGLSSIMQIFCIEHDWMRLFIDAGEPVDFSSCKIPYGPIVIELGLIGDARAIMLADQIDGQDPIFSIFTEIGGRFGYVPKVSADFSPLIAKFLEYLLMQVFCALAALDAQVCHPSKVHIRIPGARTSRRRSGDPLPYDFHILRPRANATSVAPRRAGSNDESRQKMRLHFRRGHWARRHDDPDVHWWVRWHLVGEPSLGFIDKAYHL